MPETRDQPSTMRIHEVSISDACAWHSRCISLLMMAQTSSALTKRPSYRLNAFSATLREFHGGASSALHSRWPMEPQAPHEAHIMRIARNLQITLKQFSARVLSLSTPRFQDRQRTSNSSSNASPLNSQGQPRSRKVASTSFVEFIKFDEKSTREGL